MASSRAIEEAEAFLASQQSGAPPDLRALSDEEIIRNLPDEVLLQQVQELQGTQQAQPQLPFYEQARQNTEAQIAERPSSIDYLRQVAQTPQMAQQHPFRTGLSVLSAPFEAGESIPANVGLAMQRGSLQGLPQQLMQGVTGQRPAQIGDIYRASGVPALQAMGPAAGLLLTGGNPIRGVRQGAVNRVARAGEELTRPALQMAEGIRSTTALPAKFTAQVLGQVPKVAGKIGDVVVRPLKKMASPLTEFPYRKSIEVRQGLVKYFRDINTHYGDELEKLSDSVQGVIPTPQIAHVVKLRLYESGIVDQLGNTVPEAINSLSPSERKMLGLYEEMATNPNPTMPFKAVIKQIRTLRQEIRQQARQRNAPIQADERVLSGVLHDLGVMIEPNVQGTAAKSLADINQEYAKNRQVFDLGNRLFKVFKGELDTKTGERVMSRYDSIASDMGTQLLLKRLEEATKIPFIQKAKAYSAMSGLLREGGNLRPFGIPIGPAAKYGGELLGQGAQALASAPFTAPGQVQQALIRELLKIVNTPDRSRPSTRTPHSQVLP